MRILVIDNAAMAVDVNKRFYTNGLNSSFFNDLVEVENEVTAFQLTMECNKSAILYDLEEHGVNCIPVKRRRYKLLSYIIAYLRIIPEIIKTDFVYIFYPNTFKYATFMCRLLGKKYGLYIRGMQGVDDKFSHRIYKKSYTIFTVSKYFTDKVNEIVGNEVAHTIRPMVSYNDDDIIKDRIYTDKKHYNLLFLCRIVKDKGVVELLNAIKILSQSNKYSITLTVVGYGDFLLEAKQICKDLGIEDYVRFAGSVNNEEMKKQYYLEADAYILPTYHEGFPRTLYESMIFGTPIITTFVGGIPTLMKDNFDCLKIEKKDIDSIVKKVDQLFCNYAETAKLLSLNARNTVTPIISKTKLTHGKDLNKILVQIKK